jgi:3-keto-disaccharide hydrolase
MSAAVRAGVTPKECADAPIGEWNRFLITMKGDRLTVVLNGKTVIDRAQLPGVPARGPIALQHHGWPIQFANLYLKKLD